MSTPGLADPAAAAASEPAVAAAPLEPLASLAAAGQVDPVPTGYHRPFLVDDPHQAWIIAGGHVDLYAVPLSEDGPAGVGRHLLRLGPGEVIVGVPPCDLHPTDEAGTPPVQLALRAVAAAEAEVYRMPRAGLAAQDVLPAAGHLEAVATWVRHLTEVLCRDRTVPPADVVEPGQGREVFRGRSVVAARAAVLWLRVAAGSGMFMGHERLAAGPDSGFLPISDRGWFAAEDGDVTVDVATAADLDAAALLWPSVDAFAIAALSALADALAAEDAGRAARIADRMAHDRGIFGEALDGVRRVLSEEEAPSTAADPTGDGLVLACRLVAEAAGVELRLPKFMNALGRRDPLSEIAKASRIQIRRVVLQGDWWRRDCGPLLGFLAVEGADGEEETRPVALLPASPRAYDMVDPMSGARTRLNAAAAKKLAKSAYVFYAPLPDRKLSVRDVLRFGLRKQGPDLRTVIAMGILAGLLALLTPIFTGELFSTVIPRSDLNTHFSIVLALLAAAFGSFVFETTRAFGMLRVQAKMDGTIQTAVMARLFSLPIPFFKRYSAGDLADRATGINAIREILTSSTVEVILDGVFSLFSFALLFWYSWQLALVATGLTVLVIVLQVVLTRMQLPHQRRLMEMGGKLDSIVFQLLSGLSKLRISGSEGRAFARWSSQYALEKQISYRVRILASIQQVVIAVFPVLCSVVIFGFIIWVLNAPKPGGGAPADPFDIGAFLSFNAALGQFITAALAITGCLTQMIAIKPLYERVRPILEAVPEGSAGRADPGAVTGAVRFSHIVFRYEPEGAPVINDLSLEIEPGDYVAFVGGSGCGKSTLLRLLLGFEEPESGAVYIDGKDTSTLDMNAVRRQIGVVLQNGRIASGSIFDNIVGSSPSTMEEAWEAAALAGFDEDIKAMPMGMQTVLSEGAGALSGGQKQRLLIARALIQKPRILLLDEATSALDNRTQAVVNESLDRMNMTRIVVAHRLSTILNVHRIFVLKDGKVAESGTYDELMRLDGEFAALARRQLL